MEYFGFMRAQPPQLGRGEAGHGQVAGDLGNFGYGGSQGHAGSAAAAIVPQNRRAQYLVLRVQQHRAMHLARQTDGAHRRQIDPVAGGQLVHDRFQCTPPAVRILLGPQGLRLLHGELRVRHGYYAVVIGQQQGFEFRSA